jgi:hypothetical protein
VGLPRFGLDLEQVLKELAIVHHRAAEIFGRGFATLLAKGDVVGNAIVLDDVAMIHRDVGGALLEIANGITPDLHQIGNESVRFDNGTLRVIDEFRLVGPPRLRESVAMLRRERANLQVTNSIHSFAQLTLGVTRVAVLSDESLVFRSKLRAKLIRSAFLHEHERDRHDGECHQHADQYFGVH